MWNMILITVILLVVSLSNKAHAHESKVDKAIDRHELLVEENLQFQKHLSPLTDSATAERMVRKNYHNQLC